MIKNAINILKRIISLNIKSLTVITFLFFTLSSYAQTFQVTDIVFNEKMPDHKVQRMKNKLLGRTCTITVFDNDIKLQSFDESGNPDSKPIIMQLQPNGTFKASKTDTYSRVKTIIMTVDKVMGYYRALKIEQWENQTYLWTLILKRK